MKVFEILDPNRFQPQDIEQSANDKFDQMSRGTDQGIEKLGSGLFGTAHATQEEPGTAYKVVRPTDNLERDGYYQYMKMLASHAEGSNNRYFPKVYNIEVFKSSSSMMKFTYQVEMERLAKFSTLTPEEMLQIGNNLFSNFEGLISDQNSQRRDRRTEHQVRDKLGFGKEKDRAEQEKMKIQKQKVLWGAKGEEEYTSKYKRAIEDAFYEAIKTAMTPKQSRVPGYKGPATNIKDPELKRALIILRGFIAKSYNDPGYNYRAPDIHGGNIMVRRGPYAPQLVFTDPIV